MKRPKDGIINSKLTPYEMLQDAILQQAVADIKTTTWYKTPSDIMKCSYEEGKGAVVSGRDIVTGLPVEREIPTRMVDESLEEHFNTIIDNVKVILERTPPELAADIDRHGIYLTGGASQVSHLAERLATGTGLHVNVAENPLTSVATGLAKIIKDDNYKTVAYAIEGMSK